jgi:hypothetical protein
MHLKQLKEKIKEVLEQMNSDKERTNLTDKEAKFIKNNGKIDLPFLYYEPFGHARRK